MQITDRRHFVQIGHYESKSKQASRTLMPLFHLIKVIIIPPSHPGSVHVQIHQVLKKKSLLILFLVVVHGYQIWVCISL